MTFAVSVAPWLSLTVYSNVTSCASPSFIACSVSSGVNTTLPPTTVPVPRTVLAPSVDVTLTVSPPLTSCPCISVTLSVSASVSFANTSTVIELSSSVVRTVPSWFRLAPAPKTASFPFPEVSPSALAPSKFKLRTSVPSILTETSSTSPSIEYLPEP